MTVKDFWARCLEKRCVVLPLLMYSSYEPDGNLSEEKFTGVGFRGYPNYDNRVVAPDYWYMIEEQGTGPLYATPEEALEAYVDIYEGWE